MLITAGCTATIVRRGFCAVLPSPIKLVLHMKECMMFVTRPWKRILTGLGQMSAGQGCLSSSMLPFLQATPWCKAMCRPAFVCMACHWSLSAIGASPGAAALTAGGLTTLVVVAGAKFLQSRTEALVQQPLSRASEPKRFCCKAHTKAVLADTFAISVCHLETSTSMVFANCTEESRVHKVATGQL